MSEGQFTKSEELFSITSSFRQLKRFINSLPLLKKLFLPSLILSLIAVATPQVFLWLTGIYTTCTDNSACYTSVQGLTLQITPSFLALIFFISVGSRIIAWALFEISGSFATRSFHKKI